MSPAALADGFPARPDAAGGARRRIRHRPHRAGVRDHARHLRGRAGLEPAAPRALAAPPPHRESARHQRRCGARSSRSSAASIAASSITRRRSPALLREFRRLTTAMPEGAVLLGPGARNSLVQPPRGRTGSACGASAISAFASRTWCGIRTSSSTCAAASPADGVVVQDAGDSGRWFSFHVVRTGDGGASAADRARRQPRAAAAVDAQGFRRQCLARAALAAHRDHAAISMRWPTIRSSIRPGARRSWRCAARPSA